MQFDAVETTCLNAPNGLRKGEHQPLYFLQRHRVGTIALEGICNRRRSEHRQRGDGVDACAQMK